MSKNNDKIERVEFQGVVYAMGGKIDIDDMPIEVLIGQAFDAELNEHGLIRFSGALGRAKITIEILE